MVEALIILLFAELFYFFQQMEASKDFETEFNQYYESYYRVPR